MTCLNTPRHCAGCIVQVTSPALRHGIACIHAGSSCPSYTFPSRSNNVGVDCTPLQCPARPHRRRALAVPVNVTDPPSGARGEVQALTIARPAPEDAVGDARAGVGGRHDAREGHSVTGHDEDGQEGRVADEQVPLGIDRQAVGAGDAEGLDWGSAGTSCPRGAGSQNFCTFEVVPSLCRGRRQTEFSLVCATYSTCRQSHTCMDSGCSLCGCERPGAHLLIWAQDEAVRAHAVGEQRVELAGRGEAVHQARRVRHARLALVCEVCAVSSWPRRRAPYHRERYAREGDETRGDYLHRSPLLATIRSFGPLNRSMFFRCRRYPISPVCG